MILGNPCLIRNIIFILSEVIQLNRYKMVHRNMNEELLHYFVREFVYNFSNPESKIWIQISWILINIAYAPAFTVTAIYWSLLYNGSDSALDFYLEFHVHAMQVI